MVRSNRLWRVLAAVLTLHGVLYWLIIRGGPDLGDVKQVQPVVLATLVPAELPPPPPVAKPLKSAVPEQVRVPNTAQPEKPTHDIEPPPTAGIGERGEEPAANASVEHEAPPLEADISDGQQDSLSIPLGEPPQAGRYPIAVFAGSFEGGAQVAEGFLEIEYPEPGRYHYRLEAQSVGVAAWLFPGKIEMASLGRVGPKGYLPERFTYKSSRKAERATNFDYSNGRVMFSSKETTTELILGTQDRLSVIFQVGLLLEAMPEKFNVGQSFEIPYAGLGSTTTLAFHWVEQGVMIMQEKPEPVVHLTTEPPSDRAGLKLDIWLSGEGRPIPRRFRASDGGPVALDFVMLIPGESVPEKPAPDNSHLLN